MPVRDRTGPLGKGPRTGWGMGPCGDQDAPGWTDWGPRRRFRGRGSRRWRRRTFASGTGRWGVADSPSQEQEMDMLKTQIDDIHRRIDDLSEV